MASAVINGALKKGIVTREEIIASVKTESSAQKVKDTLGITCTTDNLAVASQADYLFLAVKPQFCEEVADQIRDSLKKRAGPCIHCCRKDSGMAERTFWSEPQNHPHHAQHSRSGR